MTSPTWTTALLLTSTLSWESAFHTQSEGSRSVDYEALYSEGRTYVEFRDAATRRVQAWRQHYANAQVADAVRVRMVQIPGQWFLLVIAEDWCGDSANTIPYVAKLVDVADNLNMRIINSNLGRAIMEAHRTPDGRTATPTVILLNDRFEEVGAWVERPGQLQNWFLENEKKLDREELYDQKYAWYADDAGQATLLDLVAIIETAAAGRTR